MALIQEPAHDASNQLLTAAIAEELNGLIDPLHELGGKRHLQPRQRFNLSLVLEVSETQLNLYEAEILFTTP